MLITGDPDSVLATSSSLTRYGQLLSEIGDSLQDLDSGGWEGRAAKAFQDYFDDEPARWITSGNAFESAGTALDNYVHTLRWAQGQAAEAIGIWEQAEAATRQAQAEHQAQVERVGRSTLTAAGGSSASMPAVFQDPGAPLRAPAQAMLQRARSQLDTAGNQATDTISVAQRQLPHYDRKFGRIQDTRPRIRPQPSAIFCDRAAQPLDGDS